ncbi:MAG: hypothetical protein CMF25_05270 [Kangiellaceae bacterium]|nr:hypothetical protein [Kangiellaceae bacterium]|tara:strand:- start:20500 stop:24480 length:3981 start_codon:yes stop_codon:yes gene_type:complete
MNKPSFVGKLYRFSEETDCIEGGRRAKVAQPNYLSEYKHPINENKLPFISIVTVTYNDAEGLKKTIDAVKQQTYPHYEHIVVDGGSSDGTLALLKENEATLGYYVSAPDGGIYQAMNRGISLAQGDYVCLINAGDQQLPDFLQASVDRLVETKADFSYCRLVGEQAPSALNDGIYTYHMNVNHQTFVVSKDAYDIVGPYDESYRVVSDIKWARDAYGHNLSSTFVDQELVVFELGGISSGQSADGRQLIFDENVSDYLDRFKYLTYDEGLELYKFRFNILLLPSFISIAKRSLKQDPLLIRSMRYYLKYCLLHRPSFKINFCDIETLFPLMTEACELVGLSPKYINVNMGGGTFFDAIENVDNAISANSAKKRVLHYVEVFNRASETFIYDIVNRFNDGDNYQGLVLCDVRELEEIRPFEHITCVKWSLTHPLIRQYIYRYLLTNYNPDYIICHFALNSHKFCQRIGIEERKYRFLHMMHGIDVFLLRDEGFKEYSQFVLNDLQSKPNHHFSTPSLYLKAYATRCGINKDKISVIHNTISDRFFNYRKTGNFYDGNRELKLLSIGRLIGWKGHDHLLNGIARYLKDNPGFQLKLSIVYGKHDELLEEYRALCDKEGIADNVDFVEFVNFAEEPEYFQQFDLFVLPSTLSKDGLFRTETFGVSTLEAIASGLPVIVADAGASKEVVGDTESPYAHVVKHGSAESIYQALTNIIDEKSAFSDNLEFAQQTLERFSEPRQIQKIERVFNDELGDNTPNIALFTSDVIGGAGGAAYRCHQSFLNYGLNSTLFCRKFGKLPANYQEQRIVPLPSENLPQYNAFNHTIDRREGYTIFTSDEHHINNDSLLELVKGADAISLHWTARFLSFENIAMLSNLGVPVVLTLRDMFYLTGGCHYFHGCKKWQLSCEGCPQLPDESVDVAREVFEYKARNWNMENITMVVLSDISKRVAEKSRLFKDVNIVKINNGFEESYVELKDKATCMNELELPSDKFLLLYMPSYESKVKGRAEALATLRKLYKKLGDKLTVVVAGSSVLSKKETGFDVVNLGYISGREDMSRVYSAVDGTLIPSLEETFSNTCAEALLCGSPVAGFKAGALPEMVVEGETGFLADPYDNDGLANCIVGLMENTFDRQKCRQHIVNNFSAKRQADSYNKLFRDLVAANRAASSPSPSKGYAARYNSLAYSSFLKLGNINVKRPTVKRKEIKKSLRAMDKLSNHQVFMSQKGDTALEVSTNGELICVASSGQVHVFNHPPKLTAPTHSWYFDNKLGQLKVVCGKGNEKVALETQELQTETDAYLLLYGFELFVRSRADNTLLSKVNLKQHMSVSI